MEGPGEEERAGRCERTKACCLGGVIEASFFVDCGIELNVV
jgi:hypothetical protein